MNKEFIPYEQALALKELGFDDEVLKVYDINSSKSELYNYGEVLTGDDELYAPLKQQAFRWFREKYVLSSWIYNSDVKKYWFTILQNGRIVKSHKELLTYEEAELECLKKLIEIVKQK
jgi:hypothetical protein